jgi:predicted ATPase
VHYLPPLRLEAGEIRIPPRIQARSLEDAVNDVLAELGVDVRLRVGEVKDVGFRLFFGKASLQHVGRGLSYLLPVIQLGLVADPLRFNSALGESNLKEYEAACTRYSHIAMEEGDAHLHPKVQTRLAHWLVSLAMARRQLIVETHSDHLVRRLRGLAVRANPGSDLEKWLLENVSIVKVEQNNGVSTAETVKLTAQGSLEDWPADFMDEATDEERAIYDASLDKPVGAQPMIPDLASIEHDVGEEPELGP